MRLARRYIAWWPHRRTLGVRVNVNVPCAVPGNRLLHVPRHLERCASSDVGMHGWAQRFT
eukprot:2576316-Pleurochrysis_carterae.AAC.2